MTKRCERCGVEIECRGKTKVCLSCHQEKYRERNRSKTDLTYQHHLWLWFPEYLRESAREMANMGERIADIDVKVYL